MKTLQSVAIIAALGMSSMVGLADPKAPVTKEAAAKNIEYTADMTGIT